MPLSLILQLCLSHFLQTIWNPEEAQTLQFGKYFYYFHLFDMEPQKLGLGRIFGPSVWPRWPSCSLEEVAIWKCCQQKIYLLWLFPGLYLKIIRFGNSKDHSFDTALLSKLAWMPRACRALAMPTGVLAAPEEVQQRHCYRPVSWPPTKFGSLRWFGKEKAIPAPHKFWSCT